MCEIFYIYINTCFILGKLHLIQEGGWFIAIPLVDQIRFVIDMREKALSIAPQSAITKDNVHIHVSGNLYCQFVDAERAAYGSKNPLYAVKQHAQSSMRAAIGELELDEILHARAKLNAFIRESVQESAQAWGLDIKRYEITEVSPDKFITEAMDKQAAAERGNTLVARQISTYISIQNLFNLLCWVIRPS